MHSFSEKEKQDIVRKFIKHAGVQNYLPPYVRCGKEGESNLVVLEAMKSVYAQITTTRHIQDLTFKNVLLYVVVSTNVNTNQMHFAKTIRAFRYSI
jgi:hypothetical protein